MREKDSAFDRIGSKYLGLVVFGLAVFSGAAVAFAACNVQDQSDCRDEGSDCSAESPNCDDGVKYSGTIVDPGVRDILSSADEGQTGKNSHTSGDPCTAVCELESDCEGADPEVDVEGPDHVKLAGDECEGSS